MKMLRAAFSASRLACLVLDLERALALSNSSSTLPGIYTPFFFWVLSYMESYKYCLLSIKLVPSF